MKAVATRSAVNVYVALAVIFLIGPIVVLIGASFNPGNGLQFPPNGFSLKWFEQVIASPTYRRELLLSLVLAAVAATASLVIGFLAAAALGRSTRAWASVLTSYFLSPLIVPQVVIGAALMQYYALIGIGGTELALFLGHVIIAVPYVIRSIVGAVSEVDPALMEASRDLGASRWRTILDVMLPIIKRSAVGTWLFAFVMSWINVELSVFIAPGDLATVPVEIFNHLQYSADPVVAALSSLSAVVALVLVLAIDKLTDLESMSR
ncbi:ABC transporter permease [Brevibacterium sp. FAM 24638]|uniref:ABC transporter permease n=1 Tax=Brevibacterium sp. FAM 24638 TaxID=3415681 RepID=UPI003C79A90C